MSSHSKNSTHAHNTPTFLRFLLFTRARYPAPLPPPSVRRYDELTADPAVGAGEQMWIVGSEEFHADVLNQVACIIASLSQVPTNHAKLIKAGAIQYCATQMDMDFRIFNRRVDVTCAMAAVNLVGREESNEAGVPHIVIEKVINEMKMLTKPGNMMVAIHNGKSLLHGALEMSYSDRNKVLLLAAGVVPILFDMLSPSGTVQLGWGKIVVQEGSNYADAVVGTRVDNDKTWRAMRQYMTYKVISIILNLALSDTGKAVLTANRDYLKQLDVFAETTAAAPVPPDWHQVLSQTCFQLGLTSPATNKLLASAASSIPSASNASTSAVMLLQKSNSVNGASKVAAGGGQQQQLQQRHVMISYSWAQQPIVLKVNGALQQSGVPVWIDVEQMRGSTVDAMAAAVENAACLLIFMSREYKESANCRLEANYAQAQGVPMAFVMLPHEQGWKPNGWAGYVECLRVRACVWLCATTRARMRAFPCVYVSAYG